MFPEWTVMTPYKVVDGKSQGGIAADGEDKKVQVNTGASS